MDQLAAHERAQEVFASVLGSVAPDQMDLPTPCTEWTVQDIVDRVVGGNYHVAGSEPPGTADFSSSAAAAQAAFAAPGGLEGTMELGFGPVPRGVFVGIRTGDVLTHAWDLARATGQPTDIDPELAASMLEFTRAMVADSFRGPGRPFGAAQPCASDRPTADQLAAFLGRSVD